MEFTLKEAFGMIISLTVCGLMIFAFGNLLSTVGQQTNDNTVDDSSFFKSELSSDIYGRKAPTLLVQDIHLEVNQEFNMGMLKSYATATDEVDGDVSSSVKVYGEVDITTSGAYPIKFVAENKVGLRTAYIKNVLVD